MTDQTEVPEAGIKIWAAKVILRTVQHIMMKNSNHLEDFWQ